MAEAHGAHHRQRGGRVHHAQPRRGTKLTYGIDFRTSLAIGKQWESWTPTEDGNYTDVAAREPSEQRRPSWRTRAGYIRGGTEHCAPIANGDVWNPPCCSPQPARHKPLDLIGDLSPAEPGMAGVPVGHVVAYKAGHNLHAKFAKAVAAARRLGRRPRCRLRCGRGAGTGGNDAEVADGENAHGHAGVPNRLMSARRLSLERRVRERAHPKQNDFSTRAPIFEASNGRGRSSTVDAPTRERERRNATLANVPRLPLKLDDFPALRRRVRRRASPRPRVENGGENGVDLPPSPPDRALVSWRRPTSISGALHPKSLVWAFSLDLGDSLWMPRGEREPRDEARKQLVRAGSALVDESAPAKCAVCAFCRKSRAPRHSPRAVI